MSLTELIPRQVAMRWAPLQRGQQLGKCSYDAWGSGPTPTIDLQARRPCMGSGSSPSPTICLQARRPCMGMCWSAAEQYLTSLVQSCLLALQCVLCQRQSTLWQSGEQYLTARQAQHLHSLVFGLAWQWGPLPLCSQTGQGFGGRYV